MKKPVPTHTRYEHVGQAVVVVIAHRHAHSVKAGVQTRSHGDVFEVSRAFVPVERHRGWFRRVCLRFPSPVGRVDEEQVLVAIVVEVKERHSAAHRFGQQLVPVGAVLMNECQAAGRGDIRELRIRNFRQRFCGRVRGCGRGWLAGPHCRGTIEPPDRNGRDRRDDHTHQQRPTKLPANRGVIAPPSLGIGLVGWPRIHALGLPREFRERQWNSTEIGPTPAPPCGAGSD